MFFRQNTLTWAYFNKRSVDWVCALDSSGSIDNEHNTHETNIYRDSGNRRRLPIALHVQGLLTIQRTIPGKGQVVTANLHIYWNAECTQIASEIDWGQLRPGDIATKSVFAKNTGDVKINHSFSITNRSPSTASSCISLSWNYTGALVQPNQAIPIKLRLEVSWSISGTKELRLPSIDREKYGGSNLLERNQHNRLSIQDH